MGSMTLLGAGRPPVAAGGSVMTYRIGGIHQFAGGAENWAMTLTGVSANDWLILHCVNNGLGVAFNLGGSGTPTVTQISAIGDGDGAFSHYLCAIQLSASDISNGNLFVNANATLNFVVRWEIYTITGASAVTMKDGGLIISGTGDPDLTFPGFAPSGSTKGVGASMVDRASGGTGTTLTPPTGWTMRSNPTTTADNYFHFYTAERATGYTNASVAFGTFDTADLQSGYIWEAT